MIISDHDLYTRPSPRTVGKQSKRRSLSEGIYNLNRHADKRCYYLHFTDGDEDTLIWCAKGYRQTWGGREGVSQALKLGYQAALTLTTLPPCASIKPDSRRVSLPSQAGGTMTNSFLSSCSSPAVALMVDFCRAVPDSCLPRKYLLPVGSAKEIFQFSLADAVLMHIWQLFLCFNIMIWKLFTLDVYSCCWV